MSTDRELIELAAKAAGYEIEWVRNSGCHYRCEEEIGREQWCPLDDDADAMRLAIDLRIRLEHTGEPGDELEAVWADSTCFYVQSELCQGDRRKAAREAIVSVAAERGEAMP